jgi:tetratricopeptide (TPR) repeat protein
MPGGNSMSLVNLEKAIDCDPNDWNSYMALGNIYSFQNNYKQAAECYMEGIKVNPYFKGKNNTSNDCFTRLKVCITQLRVLK